MRDAGSRVAGPDWLTLPSHRLWLLQQASELFGFFEDAMVNPLGGFHSLDAAGRPTEASLAGRSPQILHRTARMVHCFAIATLLGRPGARRIVDAGMAFLRDRFADGRHGGYYATVTSGAVVDDAKQAYGHAFVLLAASSAKAVGHPDAERMMADILSVLEARFWQEEHGASAENASRDWSAREPYRGQNSNMHLAEALMAAFEATGDGLLLERAKRIAALIIHRHARENGWRIPEHYSPDWIVDRDYEGSPNYRPYGTTPGHSIEWSRLLVQLWRLDGGRSDWMVASARHLFERACSDGWDERGGGFRYTLNWDGAPRMLDCYWWPHCEALGAAPVLAAAGLEGRYEFWYRRVWDFVASRFIDRTHGGWHREWAADGLAPTGPPAGKTDLYHSVQACLIPLCPGATSVIGGLLGGALRAG